MLDIKFGKKDGGGVISKPTQAHGVGLEKISMFPWPPVMALLMAPPITVPTTTSPMVGAGATTTLDISGRLSELKLRCIASKPRGN